MQDRCAPVEDITSFTMSVQKMISVINVGYMTVLQYLLTKSNCSSAKYLQSLRFIEMKITEKQCLTGLISWLRRWTN